MHDRTVVALNSILPIFLLPLPPQAGGLYVYAAHYLHPLLGFISAWGYFIGKTTSAALLTHTFTLYAQQIVPFLHHLHPLMLDAGIISVLITLNSMGLFIGGLVQPLFVSMKLIPLSVGVVAGFLYMARYESILISVPHLSDFITALPLASFALMGFEATCSIAHLIEEPEKNARRAILLSFLIAALGAALFQLGLFLVSGSALATSVNPYATFLISLPLTRVIKSLLHACIFVSLIGGAFSILTSNVWNLYTLADHGFLPFKQFLTTTIRKRTVPVIALICEGIIAFVLLVLTMEQTSLQYMAVFCQFTSYTLSSGAAFMLFSHALQSKKTLLALAALTINGAFLIMCIVFLARSGISLPFFSLLTLGMVMAFCSTWWIGSTKKK